MFRLVVVTSLVLLFAAPSFSSVLVLNQDGTYAKLGDLASAAASKTAAGRTVIVSSPQVISTHITWPTDRDLKVEKGGLISFSHQGSLTGLRYAEVGWFGAKGDGESDDSMALANAASSSDTVYVPRTSSFYKLSTLSASARGVLYGAGVVKVGGKLITIPTVEPAASNDKAAITTVKSTMSPSKWPGIEGSLGNASFNADTTRTGGYGSYGNILSQYTVKAPVPNKQFDVGITSWVTSTNFVAKGAANFGMWAGANTPSSAHGGTYVGGTSIGMEVNSGNRWGDFGLQTDIGGARYTVGFQVVPDVLPATDGVTTEVYPGSFGVVIAPSIHGHRWWVGSLLRSNTVMPGGYGYLQYGGKTASEAPLAYTKIGGHWVNGIDFSAGSYSNAVMKFSPNQVSGTATEGGGRSLPSTVKGFIVIDVNGEKVKVPYFAE